MLSIIKFASIKLLIIVKVQNFLFIYHCLVIFFSFITINGIEFPFLQNRCKCMQNFFVLVCFANGCKIYLCLTQDCFFDQMSTFWTLSMHQHTPKQLSIYWKIMKSIKPEFKIKGLVLHSDCYISTCFNILKIFIRKHILHC